MTTKTKWFCRIKKGVRFTTGFFVLCGMIATAWIQLGFPMFAMAKDVEKLSRGQAQIGINVQLQAEKQLRREILDLEWKLRRIEKNGNPDDELFAQHLEAEIKELKAQLEIERSQRNAYKEQLQKLEND